MSTFTVTVSNTDRAVISVVNGRKLNPAQQADFPQAVVSAHDKRAAVSEVIAEFKRAGMPVKNRIED